MLLEDEALEAGFVDGGIPFENLSPTDQSVA
jgi:hypothetical protein